MIHITEDNFVWLDLTKKCKSARQTEELFSAHELYEVCDDGTDHLIEEIDEIPLLIKQGSRICLDVGHLPLKYIPKEVWEDTDKIQKDGYWYVKIADIN
jgi:hypothetical protein